MRQSAPVPLSDLEISKDTLQSAIESGFDHVGRIVSIITTAGREVTRELGDWATDVFELREAAQRARADRIDGAHARAGLEPDAD